jgi:rod shape-determining protein MreD
MKPRYAFLIFAAAYTVQSTLLRYVTVQGVSPNLLLSLVIVFAFLYEEPLGFAFGAVFGLLWDMQFGLYAGVSGISFMTAALAMTWLKKYLNHELPLPALVGGLLGSVLNNAVFWGIYKLTGIPHTLRYILGMQPALIACDVAMVLILHLIFRRGVIRHRKDREYKGGFKEAGRFKF